MLVGSGLSSFMFFLCKVFIVGIMVLIFLCFRWFVLFVCGFRLSIVMWGVLMLNLCCSFIWMVCSICCRCVLVIVVGMVDSGRWVVVSVMCSLGLVSIMMMFVLVCLVKNLVWLLKVMLVLLIDDFCSGVVMIVL